MRNRLCAIVAAALDKSSRANHTIDYTIKPMRFSSIVQGIIQGVR